MHKKIVLFAFATLLYVSPAQAQFGFGGGQIVFDPQNLAEAIVHTGYWIEQLDYMIKLWQDAITQGEKGNSRWNRESPALIENMAAYRTEDEILYGNGDPMARWEETFTEDEVLKDGTWQEAAIKRDHDVLRTQKTLLHLIAARSGHRGRDRDRMLVLQADVDAAKGRNQLLQATANLKAEQIWQDHVKQEVDMAIGTGSLVMSGYEINERMNREAQSRYFVTNGDKPIERVGWDNPGIY